jgi:hypothetical protein
MKGDCMKFYSACCNTVKESDPSYFSPELRFIQAENEDNANSIFLKYLSDKGVKPFHFDSVTEISFLQ